METYDDCDAALEFRERLAVRHLCTSLLILTNMLDLFRDPVLYLRVRCEVGDHICQGDGDRVMARKVEDEDVAEDLRLGQAQVGTATLRLPVILAPPRSGSLFRRADHGADKVARIGLSFGDQTLLLLDILGNVRLEGARRLPDERPMFRKVTLQASRKEVRAQNHDQDGILQDYREGVFVGQGTARWCFFRGAIEGIGFSESGG